MQQNTHVPGWRLESRWGSALPVTRLLMHTEKKQPLHTREFCAPQYQPNATGSCLVKACVGELPGVSMDVPCPQHKSFRTTHNRVRSSDDQGALVTIAGVSGRRRVVLGLTWAKLVTTGLAEKVAQR